MAGLDEISRNIGGAYGAYTFGQQNELDRQKSMEEVSRLRELIQGLQQERQFAAQKMPGVLEHQDLLNKGLAAGLPGISADSGLKQLTLAKGNQTFQSDVETALSGNRTTQSNNEATVSKNNVENLARGQTLLQQLATTSASLPPALRLGYIRSSMEKAGANLGGEGGQQLLGALSSTNPEDIPKVMADMSAALGKQLASMNPSYLGTVYSSDKHLEGTKYSANSSAGASRYTADKAFEGRKIAAEAKKGGSDLVSAIKTGKITPQNALASARLEAMQATTQEAKQFWEEFSAELQTVINNSPQSQAQAGKPDVAAAGGLPTRNPTNPYGGGPKPGTKENPIKLD